MQASLNVRRINFVSVLVVATALALGVGVGSVGELLFLAPTRTVVVTTGLGGGEVSPTPAECKRFGGPGC